MKNKYTILFTLLASASICQAQFRLLRGIDEIGIIGGVSAVNLRGSEQFERGKQTKLGYIFGIDLKLNLSNPARFKLSSKILFELKGNQQKLLVNYFDEIDQIEKKGYFESTINLNYASLPVNVECYIDKKLKLYTITGIFASYLQNAVTIQENFFGTYRISQSKITDIKNYDLGITFGFGYRFLFTKKYLVAFELNNKIGFTDVSNQDAAMSTTPIMNTNAISFNVIFSTKRTKKL